MLNDLKETLIKKNAAYGDAAARIDTIKDLAGYAILLLAADNNSNDGGEQ